VARVVDRFAGTVLDELVTTGARGDRLAIVRVDRAGRLATAVRLGWVAAPDGSLDSPGAVQRAGRLAVAAGLLLPGLICFTTVGRLWYAPGALLVGAGLGVAVDLRKETHPLAASLERNWTALLTVVLAAFYVFLGATALGLAGALGIAGGLLVLALLAARDKTPTKLAILLLLVAAIPFAALTWWSVATPLIGILLIAIGILALERHPRATATPTAVGERSDAHHVPTQ